MQTKHKQLVWGFLSIMIMLLIFYFSADTAAASDAKSSFIVDHLYPLVQSLLSVDAFTFLIRKTAHFSIYAALGFCVFHFVSLRSRSWKQACWITISFVSVMHAVMKSISCFPMDDRDSFQMYC